MAEKNIYKQKRMIKNLIIAVAVLILMIAIVVMVKNLPEKAAEEIIESTSDYVTFYKCDYEKINKITIENENGTNVFVKTSDVWSCENEPEIEINSDKVLKFVMSFGTVVGTLVEEQTQDFSPYGLDEPLSQVEIEFADGQEQEFVLGKSTATGSGYYMKLKNNPSVYIIAQYRCADFLSSLYDFRNTEIFKPELENIKAITVKNKNGDFKLNKFDAENSNATSLFMSSWQLVTPGKLEGNDEKIEQILFSEMQLNAKEFIPEAEEYHGFGDPICMARYEDIDGNLTYIAFGKMSDGNVYVQTSESDWVYVVSAENLSILDVEYLDVTSNLAMLEKIDNVESVELFFNNKNHIMSIERTGDEESYKINDLNVEEDTFKKLYQKIIGVTVDGNVTKSSIGEHLCSITFNYIDDYGTKTVDYYTYEDRFASIVIDGEQKFYTSRDKVQKIIDGVNEIIK